MITDISVLKAGGQTMPRDALERKGRLPSVTVQDTIVGNVPRAVLQVWRDDCAGRAR